MGRNGMGKTTTVRSIMGLTPPRRGSILFDGAEVAGRPAYRIARAGIGLVPEGRQIFPNLTVRENMVATAAGKSPWTYRSVCEMFPRLAERDGNMGDTLSGGEQQMLAIARALMAKPRLLLLDEPSLGLAPMLVNRIFAVISRLKETGVTILLVEQNARKALEIADRAYVMETGRIILGGDARELAANPEIEKAYLGG